MRIAVLVCTRNRADALMRCLASLRAQTLPSSEYEIVVVDNGSSDGTASRVRSSFPDVRIVAEPVEGLSRARNTGWRATQAGIVAYTDDDAIAAPDWLEEILATFDRVTPRPGLVAGRVEPVWESPRPAWMPDDVLAFLPVQTFQDAPAGPLPPQCGAAGCNIAMRREAIEAAGGFDLRLGPRGKVRLTGEDTALHDAIAKLGYPCYYARSAVLKHPVTAERLTKPWMRRRLFWEGVTQGLRDSFDLSVLSPRRVVLAARPVGGLLLRWNDWAGLIDDRDDPQRFCGAYRTLRRLGYIVGLFDVLR